MTLALHTDDFGTYPNFLFPLAKIHPAKVNDTIYKPVDPNDLSIIELAEQIRVHGLLEPIVITLDDVALSGHRRRVACELAGLEYVPVRRNGIYSTDVDFVERLVMYNTQRVKSADEIIREQLVQIDPQDAHRRLTSHRTAAAKIKVTSMKLEGRTTRRAISEARRPFLNAVLAVLHGREDYWPLSDRAIHYGLLNNPPLRHASKPNSRYLNDHQSYKSLTQLLTDARIGGEIPFETIADPTRPVSRWRVHPGVTNFVREELNDFLTGYWRDLQQPQPIHVEIVGEKNTVESIIRPVASHFTIPYTIGRGYSSLPPRHDMAKRFKATGKDQLMILFLSDFDPEGENIPHSFTRSMRDDFGLKNAKAAKVTLTHEQVVQMRLPPGGKVKEKSSRAKKFREKFGDDVFELEAVPPDSLQQLLRDTIANVIDMKLFEEEQQREANDAADLESWKTAIARSFPENLPGTD